MLFPNMLALASMLQASGLLNQAMLQAQRNQAFLNQAFPNQAVQNQQFVPVGTCEEELRRSQLMVQQLNGVLFNARGLLTEGEIFVGSRMNEEGASEVFTAVSPIVTLLEQFETATIGLAPQLTVSPVATCNEQFARSQDEVTLRVNALRTVVDRLGLVRAFLLPRMDQPGALDLSIRINNFLSAVSPVLGSQG